MTNRSRLVRFQAAFTAWEKPLQIVDRLDEVTLPYGNGEIDGIEVGLTIEAAAQISTGIDRRKILAAAWAEERQLSLV